MNQQLNNMSINELLSALSDNTADSKEKAQLRLQIVNRLAELKDPVSVEPLIERLHVEKTSLLRTPL